MNDALPKAPGEENVRERLLRLSADSARIISDIDEALFALEGKRRTLEERAIRKYFCRCVGAYAAIIAAVHVELDSDTDQSTLADCGERLNAINQEFSEELEKLLKTIRYNLNFLEQYFEHDFYTRLLQKCLFAERLEELSGRLNIAAPTDSTPNAQRL